MVNRKKHPFDKATHAVPFRLTPEERRVLDAVADAEQKTRVDLIRELVQVRADEIRRGLRTTKTRIRMMTNDIVSLKEQLADLPNLDELNEKIQIINSTLDAILRKVDSLPNEDEMDQMSSFASIAANLNLDNFPNEDEMDQMSNFADAVANLNMDDLPSEEYMDQVCSFADAVANLNMDDLPSEEYMDKVIEAADAAKEISE